MAVEVVGLIGLIMVFVLMFARVPVAVAMAVPAMAGILYLTSWTTLSAAVHSITWDHSLSYSLVTIPMFLLMGELLYGSGVTSRLYQTFQVWVGRLRGGLAIASIGGSAALAAASGSSIATTATMGTVSSKEMLKAGYDKSLAGGAIVAGGGLGILIPPSTVLIIYATLSEQSIGKLLIAGILPGVLLTLLLVLTVIALVRMNPHFAPAGEATAWLAKLRALRYVTPVLALFVVVIGGMYYGVFSPTEASAFGAVCAFLIAAARWRALGGVSGLVRAIGRTVRTTGFVFAIVLAGFILNHFLAITRLPITIAEFVGDLNVAPVVLAVLLLLMYVLLGCVMDAMAMLVVTMPIVFPLVLSMGWDPIWFGVVMVMVIELGLITPPIGLNCFVLNGVVPELGLRQIFTGALRFMVPILLAIALLYAFPEIALFLPSRM